MRSQVTFAEPEAGNASSQRREGAIVPAIPLGISKVASGAQNPDVYYKTCKRAKYPTVKVRDLQMANKVRVDFGF